MCPCLIAIHSIQTLILLCTDEEMTKFYNDEKSSNMKNEQARGACNVLLSWFSEILKWKWTVFRET